MGLSRTCYFPECALLPLDPPDDVVRQEEQADPLLKLIKRKEKDHVHN